MGERFVSVDRDTAYLMPPSVQEWLPQNHLARFVVEIVERLDLGSMTTAYRGRGSDAFHPAMMVALLFYGYATGVFSSRKLERATYDSVAFRYVAANQHPDHDTIAHFRKRFLTELSALFVQILGVAQQTGVLKVGTVSLDGTKVHANASKHSALSWEHACKIEAQLKAEVAELLRLAEEADGRDLPDGMSVPEELERREERLAAIARAKAAIEARAAERHAREQAAYEQKMAEREAKEKSSGKKPGGRAPSEPQPEPRPKDQVNLTDGDSRIMPTSGDGFEQAYNAQAAVDVDTMLIVAQHVSQHPNDKQEIEPALENLDSVAAVVGKAEALIADNGYFQLRQRRYLSHARRGALHRGRSGRALPALGRTAEGAAAGGRRCQRGRSHETSVAHRRWPTGVRPTQVHGGTDLRHHQVRAGVPPVSAPRSAGRAA